MIYTMTFLAVHVGIGMCAIDERVALRSEGQFCRFDLTATLLFPGAPYNIDQSLKSSSTLN